MNIRALPKTMVECIALEHKLATTISSLEVQLNSAKAEANATGNFANRGWFIRTTTALKHKRRDYQALIVHMGDLRKAENKRKNFSFNNVLIEVLKEQVSAAVFDACVLEAKHRVELASKT